MEGENCHKKALNPIVNRRTTTMKAKFNPYRRVMAVIRRHIAKKATMWEHAYHMAFVVALSFLVVLLTAPFIPNASHSASFFLIGLSGALLCLSLGILGMFLANARQRRPTKLVASVVIALLLSIGWYPWIGKTSVAVIDNLVQSAAKKALDGWCLQSAFLTPSSPKAFP